MAIRMSTALQNHLLASGPLTTALAFGVIHVYSGPQPASADLAPTGTLRARITNGGGVFNHGVPTNGLLLQALPQYTTVVKTPSQEWILTPLSTGDVGWWRFKANTADADQDSVSNIRLDGVIAAPYDELFLPSTTVVQGQPQTLSMFQIGFNN